MTRRSLDDRALEGLRDDFGGSDLLLPAVTDHGRGLTARVFTPATPALRRALLATTARTVLLKGWLHANVGDAVAAEATLDAARSLAVEAADDATLAYALAALGDARLQRDVPGALALYRQAPGGATPPDADPADAA
jgi:hypothetical protein